jgi:hypothetical protein
MPIFHRHGVNSVKERLKEEKPSKNHSLSTFYIDLYYMDVYKNRKEIYLLLS